MDNTLPPLKRIAARLAKSGSAVAGYAGASAITAARRMLVTDDDLFPPGTVSLNGLKLYGEEIGKVVSYAATAAQAAGSQLTPPACIWRTCVFTRTAASAVPSVGNLSPWAAPIS